MDHLNVIDELERNRDVYESLLVNLDNNLIYWKPAPEKWNLLEVICHLLDEEREDFRARTKHVLETPTEPLPSIDPQGWVVSRDYIQKNFQVTLSSFLEERAQSVKWLKSLSSPKWDNAYEHPKFGIMTARMFLFNWLAHDYFHFRQITRLKFDYLQKNSNETLSYAGNW